MAALQKPYALLLKHTMGSAWPSKTAWGAICLKGCPNAAGIGIVLRNDDTTGLTKLNATNLLLISNVS